MILESIPQVSELSPEEQLQLASEIWEENIDQIGSVEAQAAFEKLLKARLAEYRENPDGVVSLEEIRRKAGLG